MVLHDITVFVRKQDDANSIVHQIADLVRGYDDGAYCVESVVDGKTIDMAFITDDSGYIPVLDNYLLKLANDGTVFCFRC